MAEATGMSLRDKMFSFDGRLRRQDYWGISIGLGLAVFILTEAVMLYGFGPRYSLLIGGLAAGELRATEGWPYVVQWLINVVTIWPNLAMSAKRAHDRDKSARFIICLLAVFWVYNILQVPLIGWSSRMAATPLGAAIYLAVSVMTLALCVYLFVVVGCLAGTRGPNRFGPSPKADELAEVT